jgi:hypothetical protein
MERTGHSVNGLTNVNVIKDTQNIHGKVRDHAGHSDKNA